jgi:hypothetical protein
MKFSHENIRHAGGARKGKPKKVEEEQVYREAGIEMRPKEN